MSPPLSDRLFCLPDNHLAGGCPPGAEAPGPMTGTDMAERNLPRLFARKTLGTLILWGTVGLVS